MITSASDITCLRLAVGSYSFIFHAYVEDKGEGHGGSTSRIIDVRVNKPRVRSFRGSFQSEPEKLTEKLNATAEAI